MTAPPFGGAVFISARRSERSRLPAYARRSRSSASMPAPRVERCAHPRERPPKLGRPQPGDVDRRRGVEDHGRASPSAARSPSQHGEHRRRVLRRRAARQLLGVARRRIRSRSGRSSTRATAPSRISTTCVGPSGEISSIPGSPCTTSACTVPSARSAPAISGTRRASATPTTCRPALAGLASGPTMFITVGIAELAAHRPDVSHGRMHQRREHEHDARLAQRALHHRHGAPRSGRRAPRARRRCRTAR